MFFDDQLHNFEGRACPASAPQWVRRPSQPATNDELRALWVNLSTPAREALVEANIPLKWYAPRGGINPMREAMRFANSPPSHVVFDWDQTLSVFDGVSMKLHGSVGAEVLFGGRSRRDDMRHMFQTLNTLQIPYFVLTKNPVARRNVIYFQEILDAVDGKPQWIKYSTGTKLDVMALHGLCG